MKQRAHSCFLLVIPSSSSVSYFFSSYFKTFFLGVYMLYFRNLLRNFQVFTFSNLLIDRSFSHVDDGNKLISYNQALL